MPNQLPPVTLTDGVNTADVNTILQRAMRLAAIGNAEQGVECLRSDEQVESAQVIVVRVEAGPTIVRQPGEYNAVALRIRGRQRDIEVWINRGTGESVVTAAHKPLSSP